MKIFAAALAAIVVCLQAALSAPAPIAVYGQLPTLSDVSLSPDGTTLAYIRGGQTKRVIVIAALGATQPPVIIDVTGKKVRWLQWVGSSHLIITTSTTTVPLGLEGERQEYYTAQSYDLRTHALVPLLEHVKKGCGVVLNTLSDRPEPRIIDGHPVVFIPGWYFGYNNKSGDALYRIDFDTGETTCVSRYRSDVSGSWLIGEKGNILAEQVLTRLLQHWVLVLGKEDRFNQVALDIPSPIDTPQIIGLNEDGSAIIVAMPPTVEGVKYQQVALKDGHVTDLQNDAAKAGSLITDEQTSRIIGVQRLLDRTDYVFFDPKLDSMWRSVKAAFATATELDITSWSDDKTKAVLRVFGPQIGDGYFVLDLTAKKAYPVAPAYDGITEYYERKWIDYRAGDGRTIHAYLTIPKRDTKSLPLIVLPHGGPHARDEPGFDWLSQSLASRGYVVLQPQFRGSEGFGQELLEAGFGEFGKKMQTDLSDGVRALAAQGLIDPKRVCIVGASYGGYAALAGATLDTGVYRCAVSIAGLSDMRDMINDWPHPKMSANSARFWDRFLGVTGRSFDKLDVISPIKHVDKVTIPILLIHGKDDTVVPFSQSEEMADALKAAKKPYEFVTLTSEDHWLSNSATRLQMLEATIKFLESNNPPN